MSAIVDQGGRYMTISVDAGDSAIQYSPEGWSFNHNSSVTRRGGSSMSFQFIGTRVQWVGTADPAVATYMVDSDVVTSRPFPDLAPSFPGTSRVLFETPLLPLGFHNLSVVLHREGSSLSLSQLVIQNGSTIVDSQVVAGSVHDMQPLYRRSQSSSGSMSTTAVLAGVFGSFGFFLLVGGIFFIIRRRRMQRQRTQRKPSRRTEAKQDVAIEEIPPSSRRAKPASPASPPRASSSQRPKERRGTKSPNRARHHEPTSQPPRPKERGGTDSPNRDRQLEPSSRSPRLANEPRQSRRHENSQRPPHSPETPTTPGNDVDPRSQSLVAPNPQRFRNYDHDTQEEPRAETPVPLHPPLRFSPAPARSGSSSPSPVIAVSRRQEWRHISGLMGDSDTEYLSDASVQSRATRQTLMSTIGASRRAGSLQATAPPRPQPQQQVVLDLPPAYTPE